MTASIGLDIGGTFVDAALVIDGETRAAAKAPSTPADPVLGVLAAVTALADAAGWTRGDLLRRAGSIVHGTTVGLNALLTRTGSPVGLLTTRGHEDALLIGRVHQKVAGLGPDARARVSELAKPEPLVPRRRIHGIHERIDATGQVVARLDEPGVLAAVDRLRRDGVEAVAIGFLWSFRNPDHELRARELVIARHPQLEVSISSDVAPVIGEYERVAATVVNAHLRRAQAAYLGRLGDKLREAGFGGSLSVLLSSGGAADVSTVEHRPVETLRSGPAGGVIAVAGLGARMRVRNLLATDMGGTSFDVGLVLGGRPDLTDQSLAGRFHIAVPTVDIASVGAGGGSVAWVDADGNLHVGPRSAGSVPGPACYDRGGHEATVTDADLVLGRLDAVATLGGEIRLDRGAAHAALEPLAAALGVGVPEAAVGIVRVADARMADLIRQVTIERGHDPRRLVLVAYGGAAGLHAAAFGFDAGAVAIVLPRYGSMLSAVGLALARPQRMYRTSGPAAVPLHEADVQRVFGAMERQARADLQARTAGALRLRREIGFRYRRQTHEVVVPLPAAGLDRGALERCVERFEQRYEALHGRGTGYRAAGIEATSFRLVATVAEPARTRSAMPPGAPSPRTPRPASRRPVVFDRWTGATDVFDGNRLRPGDRLDGPAVIDWPTTGALIHPGHRATVDALGHVRLERGM